MKTIFCILLGALALAAAPDTNVTGKWAGGLIIVSSDGQAKESTALLVLKQTGTEITGTVGPNGNEQHAITKGTIDGATITLESADGGISMTFDLTLAGDRITGNVNAVGEGRTMKARLDVTRAK